MPAFAGMTARAAPAGQSSGRLMLRASEHLLRRSDDSFRLEAEFLQQFLKRSGTAEGPHGDDLAGAADVAVPTQGRRLLDGNARRDLGGQHAVAIRLRLVLEDIP